MQSIERTSDLATSAEAVWATVTTPAGINAELMPFLRMTAPRGVAIDLATVDPPVDLGRSWLLLFGVLPVEYDDLRIEGVGPGFAFAERSSMLTMRRWHHDRVVEPTGLSTCRLTDRVAFEGRVPLGAIARPLVAGVFAHRHHKLRARFGAA